MQPVCFVLFLLSTRLGGTDLVETRGAEASVKHPPPAVALLALLLFALEPHQRLEPTWEGEAASPGEVEATDVSD